MKKLICILFLLVAMLLSGCGNNKKKIIKDDSNEKTKVSQEALENEEKSGENSEEDKSDIKKETDMDGVFRYADWGDSKEKVIELEGRATLETDKVLYYKNESLLSFDNTDIVYTFDDNKFISGMYAIQNDHADTDDYAVDYAKVKIELDEKYGEPYEGMEQGYHEGLGEVAICENYDCENELKIGHLMGLDDSGKVVHYIFYSNVKNEEVTDKSGL